MNADAKPRFRVIAGRPVEVKPANRIDAARQRFGRPFSHEPGTDWKPRDTPFLSEWLAGRIQEKG